MDLGGQKAQCTTRNNAVPYGAVKKILSENISFLKDKVLIDPTNALNSDYSGLLL